MSRRAEVIVRAREHIWDGNVEGFEDAVHPVIDVSASPIEDLMFVALTAVTWNDPCYRVSQQVHAGKYRVDFLLDFTDPGQEGEYAASVAVECDGHDFHEKTKAQAKRDKKRDRDLLAIHLETLRYTGSEIYADPFACALQARDHVSTIYYRTLIGPAYFEKAPV